MPRTIRIGNGCGFWGDNLDAPIILAERGQLDYLTLEYLAELTMSILAGQKERDPQTGFATDFPDVLERLVPVLKKQPNLKIITNAGGMNPQSCGKKAKAILKSGGLADRRVATVSGDDLLPRLDEALAQGERLNNLDTNEPLETIRERVVSANAYLGAVPIVEALQKGASIVITGRVADASLTVAPAVHEFGWKWNDWDRLSAATVAGHIIECGAQATGGLWCNWQDAPAMADVGYPIAEIEETGVLRISKPAGTGGAVNVETISEQLLYEVGNLAAYMTPDVVADFTSLALHEAGKDVVEITNCKGNSAPDKYKVSIAYRDGYMASGTLVIYGIDCERKAAISGRMLLERVERAGYKLERTNIELLGSGGVVPRHGELAAGIPAGPSRPPEVVLRVSAHDSRRAAVQRFAQEFAPLVTSGLPGTTGYTSGRPAVRDVFAYWPALIDKRRVTPVVTLME